MRIDSSGIAELAEAGPFIRIRSVPGFYGQVKDWAALVVFVARGIDCDGLGFARTAKVLRLGQKTIGVAIRGHWSRRTGKRVSQLDVGNNWPEDRRFRGEVLIPLAAEAMQRTAYCCRRDWFRR